MVTIDAVVVDAANDDPAPTLVDYDDAPLFPLPKKPHVYYW